MEENDSSPVDRTKVTASLTDKEIRQFLVELTKQRTMEMLNLYSDKDMDKTTIIINGTSPAQVQIVRSWLKNVASPILFDALIEAVHQEDVETAAKENHDTAVREAEERVRKAKGKK